MILDIDGKELNVGDVCIIVCACIPVSMRGTEARIVEIWPSPSNFPYNCQCACEHVGGELRYAISFTQLRRKSIREDLQVVSWSDLRAIGVDPRRELEPA